MLSDSFLFLFYFISGLKNAGHNLLNGFNDSQMGCDLQFENINLCELENKRY